jgi:hypothetical protein
MNQAHLSNNNTNNLDIEIGTIPPVSTTTTTTTSLNTNSNGQDSPTKNVPIMDQNLLLLPTTSQQTNNNQNQHLPPPPTTTINIDPHPYHYPAPARIPKWTMSHNIPPPPIYKRKVGRFYVCCNCSNSDDDLTWACMMGPCWPMWFVTFTLITGLSFGVLYGLARNNMGVLIAGGILVGIVIGAFIATGCRNPGIVRRTQQKCEIDDLYDDVAQSYRPQNAIYEYESQTAIRHVDHFCPWTGTVIANDNLLAFQVFTNTLCILVCFAIGVVIWGLTANKELVG